MYYARVYKCVKLITPDAVFFSGSSHMGWLQRNLVG